MPSDPTQRLATLLAELTPVQQRACAAAERVAATADGQDGSQMVTVSLDADGRVSAVRVRAGWRRLLPMQDLGAAVCAAVEQAAAQRLTRWGSAYASESAADQGPAPAREDDLARQLQAAVSGAMSSDDVRSAVLELLAMAEDLERGLDEVSAALPPTLAGRHIGRSQDRRVTVTVSGGGEVVDVGYELRWLRTAHEINIARLTMAAFTAAYATAEVAGVDRLIAGSRLGAVQRETQDPFGLARRLRLSD